MKLFDDNPFHIIGQLGEQIAVKFQSENTALVVSYALSGETGSISEDKPIVFSLLQNLIVLDLTLNFSNPRGGVYRIRVTGSAGGDESDYTLKQAPNSGTRETLSYMFSAGLMGAIGDLGGDETKPPYE